MRSTLAFVLGTFMGGVTSAQSVSWSMVTNSVPPSPRRIPNGFARDEARGVFLIFGGGDVSLGAIADTWAFDGATWSQRSGAGPIPRVGHALAYDPRAQEILLFGGTDSSGAQAYADTWSWNGTSWSQRQPARQPPGRQYAALVDFPSRSRVVLMTGWSGPGTALDDTWEWDGANWIESFLPPGARYSPRLWSAATYDVGRDRIVMFGGASATNYLDDTWDFDGSTWTQIATAVHPSARHTPSIAYSHDLRLVIVFGGENSCTTLNDLWSFNGSSWTQLQQNGSGVGPGIRGGAGMVWDSMRQGLLVVQGRTRSCTNHADSSEVWHLALTPAVPASFVTFGPGCPGSRGTPVLAASIGSLPRIGSRFDIHLTQLPAVATVPIGVVGFSSTFNSSPLGTYSLPHDLGPIGMPGCTQLVSDDGTFFMLALTGQVVWPLTIPNDSRLAGVSFFVQAAVPDLGVNAIGATVTNAGAGIVGF